LPADDIFEIGLEDIVTEHQHKFLIDVLLGLQKSMCESVLLALMRVRDRHSLELVAVVADDVLFLVADDHDEFVGTKFHELLETVCENRFPCYLNHSFRFVLCEGPESRTFSRSENDCLHKLDLPTGV
jgi:hypothetical protein